MQYSKIYDVKNTSVISLNEMVEKLEKSDVIFFGEQHNDSIAHFLQDSLYRSLLRHYPSVTLSMEMFERDVQLVLEEYLMGHISASHMEKDARAWKNYADYKNMVETAKKSQQKVIAANAPARYVNMVSRNGLASLKNLDKVSKKYFAPLPLDTSNTEYQKKFMEAMGDHGHSASNNFFHAQLLRDATMSHAIFQVWRRNKSDKILHINGRFHSDEKLGTVNLLSQKNRRMRISTISCFPAKDFLEPNWEEYKNLADFIILTDPTVPKTF